MDDGRETVLVLTLEEERLKWVWEAPSDGLPSPYRQIRLHGDPEEGLYGLGGVLDHVNHRGQNTGIEPRGRQSGERIQ